MQARNEGGRGGGRKEKMEEGEKGEGRERNRHQTRRRRRKDYGQQLLLETRLQCGMGEYSTYKLIILE